MEYHIIYGTQMNRIYDVFLQFVRRLKMMHPTDANLKGLSIVPKISNDSPCEHDYSAIYRLPDIDCTFTYHEKLYKVTTPDDEVYYFGNIKDESIKNLEHMDDVIVCSIDDFEELYRWYDEQIKKYQK